MEGDGEVIIGPVQNCSHCESGECDDLRDSGVCFCEEDLALAPDRVSCINVTGLPHPPTFWFVSLLLLLRTVEGPSQAPACPPPPHPPLPHSHDVCSRISNCNL